MFYRSPPYKNSLLVVKKSIKSLETVVYKTLGNVSRKNKFIPKSSYVIGVALPGEHLEF